MTVPPAPRPKPGATVASLPEAPAPSVRRPEPGRRPARYPVPAMVESILMAFQVFLAVMLIVLVLLHSGKDTGLSGAFGVGTGAGPFGGGSLVERNLNRWTIAFALAFVINIFILLKI